MEPEASNTKIASLVQSLGVASSCAIATPVGAIGATRASAAAAQLEMVLWARLS
jgi:hypothetical protein